MAGSPARVRSDGEGAHLVLYDGVCGLCSHLVQFVLEHDRRAAFSFAALGSDVGKTMVERFGGDANALTTFYVLANYRGDHARMFGRSRAALFVAAELGWPWKAAILLNVLPAAILDRAYDLVARTRYRWFGRLEQCLVPQPEFAGRFIDG